MHLNLKKVLLISFHLLQIGEFVIQNMLRSRTRKLVSEEQSTTLYTKSLSTHVIVTAAIKFQGKEEFLRNL